MGLASKIIDFIENKGQNDSIRYIYTLVPPKYEETNKLFTKLDYNIRTINCYYFKYGYPKSDDFPGWGKIQTRSPHGL